MHRISPFCCSVSLSDSEEESARFGVLGCLVVVDSLLGISELEELIATWSSVFINEKVVSFSNYSSKFIPQKKARKLNEI